MFNMFAPHNGYGYEEEPFGYGYGRPYSARARQQEELLRRQQQEELLRRRQQEELIRRRQQEELLRRHRQQQQRQQLAEEEELDDEQEELAGHPFFGPMFGGRARAQRPTSTLRQQQHQPRQHQQQQPQQQQQRSSSNSPQASKRSVPVGGASSKPAASKSPLELLMARTRGRAASKIQKWYRSILASRLAQRQAAAAPVIQAFMKRYAACHAARKYCKSLRELRKVESKIQELTTVYMSKLLGRTAGHSRDLLVFNDALEKAIISLDVIDTLGQEELRSERRRIVRVAQESMRQAEQLKSKAEQIQRWWRGVLAARQEARKPAAAQTVVRTLQRAVAQRKASRAAAQVSEARQLVPRLSALQAAFQSQLAALAAEAARLQQQAQTGVCGELAAEALGQVQALQDLLTRCHASTTVTTAAPAAAMDTSISS